MCELRLRGSGLEPPIQMFSPLNSWPHFMAKKKKLKERKGKKNRIQKERKFWFMCRKCVSFRWPILSKPTSLGGNLASDPAVKGREAFPVSSNPSSKAVKGFTWLPNREQRNHNPQHQHTSGPHLRLQPEELKKPMDRERLCWPGLKCRESLLCGNQRNLISRRGNKWQGAHGKLDPQPPRNALNSLLKRSWI